MHSAAHGASSHNFHSCGTKRGWFPPPCHTPARDTRARADRRRGPKGSSSASRQPQQQSQRAGGKNGAGSNPDAWSRSGKAADRPRETQRVKELQRTARRASSRAADVGAARQRAFQAAKWSEDGRRLQMGVAADVEDDGGNNSGRGEGGEGEGSNEDDEDWVAVAAAATGRSGRATVSTPSPSAFPHAVPGDTRRGTGGGISDGFSGGGGSSDGATARRREHAPGKGRVQSASIEAEDAAEERGELWPSHEAVAGSVPADAATAIAAATAVDPSRLVQALRAAQAADRQLRMLTGGGGLGPGRSLPAAIAGGCDADDADLVPYVDVALKELGLPPRQQRSRRGGQNRKQEGQQQEPSERQPPQQQQQQRQRHQRQQELYKNSYSSGGGQDDDDDADGDEEDDGGGGGVVVVVKDSKVGPTRSRGAKRGALRELLESYQRIWCRALDLELEEEWTESEERLKSWKRSRLEAEGYALFDLTAAPDHHLFRDAILRFFVPDRPLPYHCLGAGDIVLVSPNNRPSEASLEGVVLDFSGRWIRVALPADLAHGVQGSGWRLDLYANTIAHERARGAVKRYCQAAAESGGSSSSSKGSGSDNDDGGNNGSGGGGGGGSLTILRALAGSVPPGSSLEQMAAAAPPWLRGKTGRERLTAARRVVAAATATEAEAVEPVLLPPSAAAAVAAGLPLPAGAAVSRPVGQQQRRRRRTAGLNPSQARAIEAALGRNLTLWQGPPGTGKTATLLHFIRAALAALPPGAGPLLATAASNVAVDNLVSGLRALDPSLDVVRVGQPVKVAPELRGVSLEARIAGTSAGQRAAQLRRQAQGLRGSEAWTYISQALELEDSAARDILSGSQVVAATCIGCGEPRVQALSFPVVVLDEATQATEPHSLVPLLSQVHQVVLVGDPQQLPPTVKSQKAEELGLDVPLFERLQFMGLTPLLLDTQYRMHPAIAAFPSAAFYGGRLRSATDPRDRRPPSTFPWPNPKVPVCFIPVLGRESRTNTARDPRVGAASDGAADGDGGGVSSGGYSYQNDDEAAAVAAVVGALLSPSGPLGSGLDGPGDIGIVTPYNGQVRRLQQLVTHGSRLSRGLGPGPDRGSRPGSFLRIAAATVAGEGEGGVEGLSAEDSVLQIKSVDGFQGREKEVIVFSAVRSNSQGRLGFLSDYRRLNVAITRARRGLVVVGNPNTLARDRLWARWLAWVEGHGCVMQGGWPPPGPGAATIRTSQGVRGGGGGGGDGGVGALGRRGSAVSAAGVGSGAGMGLSTAAAIAAAGVAATNMAITDGAVGEGVVVKGGSAGSVGGAGRGGGGRDNEEEEDDGNGDLVLL